MKVAAAAARGAAIELWDPQLLRYQVPDAVLALQRARPPAEPHALGESLRPLKGLLLPAIEGVDSVDEQIRIACMKAGISPQEDIDLYRFEVRRYR